MLRPKSMSQLVIYSSNVRPIQFAVPRLLRDVQSEDCSARWSSEPSLDQHNDVISASSSSSKAAAHFRKSKTVCTDSLGSLDPQLYLDESSASDDVDCTYYADDNIGRVWISVEYSADSERLAVTLVQIKNLPSRVRGTANSCDPLVRMSLMPDERRWMQSKVKKKTCNPVYDEVFIFQVTHKELTERAIKLIVYDVDRCKRHVIIGYVVHPLTSDVYDEKITVWRDLQRELVQLPTSSHDTTRELQLSLSYNDSIHRLTVGVFSGRHFTCSCTNSITAEYYVKVRVSTSKSETKKKRTAAVKPHHNSRTTSTDDDGQQGSAAATDDISLVFNESFTFHLPNELLNATSVTVSAVQSMGPARRDVLVGRIVLGSFMFARGPELDHWTQMMTSLKQQISRWHKLS